MFEPTDNVLWWRKKKMVTTNFSSPRTTRWLWKFPDFKSFVSFYAPSFMSGSFFEATRFLQSCQQIARVFIRGVKKEGDICQEQSLDSSQIHFHHHQNMCTETHLQNLQSAPHPIRMVYFSHTCLLSALKKK